MNSGQLHIADWIDKISTKGLPALRSTILAVSKLDDKDEMSIEQLANFIGQDPNLVFNILRRTQGAYQNPFQARINTVKRSIVLLGFNEIKSICLSLALFEDLNTSEYRKEYLSEIGVAFHAAIQAKRIALENKQNNTEEIFIATLLSKIGNFSFWSLGGEYIEKMALAFKAEPQLTSSKIEKKVLGFSLEELSRKLIKSWNLGSYLYGKHAISFDYVKLGFEIAESVAYGWDSPELNKVIVKVANFLKISQENAISIIKANAEYALSHSLSYCIPGLCHELEDLLESDNLEVFASDSLEKINQSDNFLLIEDTKSAARSQLLALNNMNKLAEAGGSILELITYATQIMHDCLAIDRVVYSEISKDYSSIAPKVYLTNSSRSIKDIFKIELKRSGLISEILEKDQALWMLAESNPCSNENISENLLSLLKMNEGIFVPLTYNKTPIGLFYMDRGIKKNSFVQEDFDSLKYFVLQLELAIKFVAMFSAQKN
jgi:HD-like signal output (HDOD) protein